MNLLDSFSTISYIPFHLSEWSILFSFSMELINKTQLIVFM